MFKTYKDFKEEWEDFAGDIPIFETNHFSIGIDNNCFGIGFDFDRLFDYMLTIRVVCIVFRIFWKSRGV